MDAFGMGTTVNEEGRAATLTIGYQKYAAIKSGIKKYQTTLHHAAGVSFASGNAN